MLLRPKAASQYVVYSRGGSLQIFSHEEWESAGPQGRPTLTLNESEAGSLAYFLNHWIDSGKCRPGYLQTDVDADFGD